MQSSRVLELEGLGSMLDAFPSSSSGPDVQDDPTTEHLGTRRPKSSKVAMTSVGVGSKLGLVVGELVGCR